MNQYIIAYLGGSQPSTPEEGKAQRQLWETWLGDLGDAVVDPGTPLMHSKVVSKDGVTDAEGPKRLTGFTVVQAETLDAALEMAKACPFLTFGDLQVSQMMKM